jgi:hypothetical protein
MNSADLQHGLVALVIAVTVVAVVRFEVLCLSDIARTRDSEFRYLTRVGWIVACLITIPVGGVVYLLCGRTR